MNQSISLRSSVIPMRVRTATAVIAFLFLVAPLGSAQNTSRTEGWVVLPVEDYRALRRAASTEERPPDRPPVEATLTRVDYDLRVEGEIATGEARLTVDVIKDGWVRVPMPPNLMVREARLDGRPVPIVASTPDKGGGAANIILSRSGRTQLTLSIVVPVTAVAATEILQLPAGTSAVSHAVVVLPRQGFDVRVTGGLLLEKAATATESRWIACGRGNEPLTFSWRRKTEDQRSAQPLRLRAMLTELVGLGEDSTQINAEVQIEVLQGLANEARIAIPEQLTVNQVSGAMIADWSTASNELLVTFLEPVVSATRFTIVAEARLAQQGQIDVPILRVSAAERETGGLAVEVLGAGEVKNSDARGMDEADASALGQLISSRQSPSLVGFRLRPADGKSARALSIRVDRYASQAVLTANVEEARYSLLASDEGKVLVHSRFAVRNNQRNFLKLDLPSTAVLWSASVSGRPVRPGRAPDGSLLIPLEKGRAGEEAPAFAVEVAYFDRLPAWGEKGKASLSLVSVDLPISKSAILLHHSPKYRVIPVPGSFRVQTYAAPTSSVLGGTSIPPADGPASQSGLKQGDDEKSPALVSRFRQQAGGARTSRHLPVRVTVPAFGPSVFLVSELTSESQHPILELDFQRDKKRGEL